MFGIYNPYCGFPPFSAVEVLAGLESKLGQKIAFCYASLAIPNKVRAENSADGFLQKYQPLFN